eukprot:2224634-Heterocapsa_arctica.AAC.1
MRFILLPRMRGSGYGQFGKMLFSRVCAPNTLLDYSCGVAVPHSCGMLAFGRSWGNILSV